MKLIRNNKNKECFDVSGCTDSELIDFYSISINYKPYIEQISSMPDKELLKLAPGSSASEVRDNLNSQKRTCEKIIDMWNQVISAGGVKAIKN